MKRQSRDECVNDARRHDCVPMRCDRFAALFLALLAGCEQQTTATYRDFEPDRPLSAATLSVDRHGRRVLSVLRPEPGKAGRLNSYAIEQMDVFTNEAVSALRMPGYGAIPSARIDLFRSVGASENEEFVRISLTPWSDSEGGLNGSGRAYLTRSTRAEFVIAAESNPETYRRPVMTPLLDERGTLSWAVVVGADSAWGPEGQRVQLDPHSVHLLDLREALEVTCSVVCEVSPGFDELICLRGNSADAAWAYRIVVVAADWLAFGWISAGENGPQMMLDKRLHTLAPLRVNRLVDQDADGVDDIAVATRFGAKVLSGRSGDEISAFDVGLSVYAIGDINGDGRQDWILDERESATRRSLVLGTHGARNRAQLASIENCFACLELGVHYLDASRVPTLLYQTGATVIVIDPDHLLSAVTELNAK